MVDQKNRRNPDAHLHESLLEERINGFVVACIKSAYLKYPAAIDTALISADDDTRDLGMQMLDLMRQVDILAGTNAELTFSLHGYRSVRRALGSNTVVERVLSGDTDEDPSEFVLELLRKHATCKGVTGFLGL